MKRLFGSLVLIAALALPASASADFGFKTLEAGFVDTGGEAALQAGAHPFGFTATLAVNTVGIGEEGKELPTGELEDLKIASPAGLAADPTAVPRCPTATFIIVVTGDGVCPDETAVGVTKVNVSFVPELPETEYEFSPAVYNLPPPPGVVARFGFAVVNVPVIIDVGVTPDPPYRGLASLTNISNFVQFFGSTTTLWGNPSASVHDTERGICAEDKGSMTCPVEALKKPFLTAPRSCTGPLVTDFRGQAWNSGEKTEGSAITPPGMNGCARLGFGPRLDAQPTNHSAEGPSGFDFNLDIEDEGLTNPEGLAASDIKKAVVTLPAGVTANPSVAEGLTTCSPQDLERETVASQPGEGCPQASKVGTAEVQTPILEGTILRGEIFIASPDDPATPGPGAENPFDSLLALYLVVKDPGLGVIVKQATKIEPDSKTGQLIATMDDLPQFPLGHVSLHFREGGRSPLITPPTCGTYTTQALFYPWADPENPLPTTSDFQITRGVGAGPCPPAGAQPFDPGFGAGTTSNDAGQYSPFNMRLTRRDGDQDLTKFSTTLPPGLAAKLAGVSRCPDAAIALAKTKTGKEEVASPSCPPNSRIGRTVAGAGVGSELTYVPGSVYLAGPYNGAPFSVVAIVPAVAGPFDVGNVVVRLALRINPKTTVATVDGAASDPIPHILAGIPLRVRDIRAYVDRPQFTFNPTNCDPFAVGAELWGGGADPFSSADDAPVPRSARFRAANCASLGFKPSLDLRLNGGTRRGGHPALRATVTPRPGDANFSDAVVTLPRSAFLDQSHIRTICTRVQFAANACPAAAIYGFAKAITPILDEPIEGPVYLRSSNHKLPDLVAALKGPPSAPVNAELIGRIDSHKGGIRSSFEAIPDIPVSSFVLTMRGGNKGLIVNSRNLCANKSRAIARFTGQNGRHYDFEPLVRATKCKHSHARKAR